MVCKMVCDCKKGGPVHIKSVDDDKTEPSTGFCGNSLDEPSFAAVDLRSELENAKCARSAAEEKLKSLYVEWESLLKKAAEAKTKGGAEYIILLHELQRLRSRLMRYVEWNMIFGKCIDMLADADFLLQKGKLGKEEGERIRKFVCGELQVKVCKMERDGIENIEREIERTNVPGAEEDTTGVLKEVQEMKQLLCKITGIKMTANETISSTSDRPVVQNIVSSDRPVVQNIVTGSRQTSGNNSKKKVTLEDTAKKPDHGDNLDRDGWSIVREMINRTIEEEEKAIKRACSEDSVQPMKQQTSNIISEDNADLQGPDATPTEHPPKNAEVEEVEKVKLICRCCKH